MGIICYRGEFGRSCVTGLSVMGIFVLVFGGFLTRDRRYGYEELEVCWVYEFVLHLLLDF